MQVSILQIFVQLQFLERDSFIRKRKKKAVLIQSRNIFQVKAYFYSHRVKFLKWVETYQNTLIILSTQAHFGFFILLFLDIQMGSKKNSTGITFYLHD